MSIRAEPPAEMDNLFLHRRVRDPGEMNVDGRPDISPGVSIEDIALVSSSMYMGRTSRLAPLCETVIHRSECDVVTTSRTTSFLFQFQSNMKSSQGKIRVLIRPKIVQKFFISQKTVDASTECQEFQPSDFKVLDLSLGKKRF